MFVLVSYDVSDDGRRGKVARALQDFGGKRVQFSVFECYVTERNRAQLQERLANIIDPEEDSVRIYRLCDQCRANVLLFGRAEPTEEPGLRII